MLLSAIFDPTQILPAHRSQFLQGIAYNDRGLPMYNAWIQTDSNFPLLMAQVPAVGPLLTTTLSYNTQQADIDTLYAFFDDQTMTPQVATSIANGLSVAASNVAWLAIHQQPITDYLQSGVWRRQS